MYSKWFWYQLASDTWFQNGLFHSYISGEDYELVALDREEVKIKFTAQEVNDIEVWKICIMWSSVQQKLVKVFCFQKGLMGMALTLTPQLKCKDKFLHTFPPSFVSKWKKESNFK